MHVSFEADGVGFADVENEVEIIDDQSEEQSAVKNKHHRGPFPMNYIHGKNNSDVTLTKMHKTILKLCKELITLTGAKFAVNIEHLTTSKVKTFKSFETRSVKLQIGKSFTKSQSNRIDTPTHTQSKQVPCNSISSSNTIPS